MTPRSFDSATCREMVGDERARSIEQKARTDADALVFDPPKVTGSGHWGWCQAEFSLRVYAAQFGKRLDRNARKAAA